jgi:hypothetical protein
MRTEHCFDYKHHEISCSVKNSIAPGMYAVPHSVIHQNKKNLNMTERGDRSYWHIALTTLEDGSLALNLSRIGKKLSQGHVVGLSVLLSVGYLVHARVWRFIVRTKDFDHLFLLADSATNWLC